MVDRLLEDRVIPGNEMHGGEDGGGEGSVEIDVESGVDGDDGNSDSSGFQEGGRWCAVIGSNVGG